MRNRLAAVLLSVLVAAGATVLATSVRSPSTGAAALSHLRIPVVADTYASQLSPNRTYGGSVKLAAGSRPGDRKVIYLRFAAELPPGTSVAGARIVLTRDLHHLPGEVRLQVVDDTSWDEAKLTGRNAPAVGDVLDVVHPARSDATVTFDAASRVRGAGTYAFAVTAPATDDVARFRSREEGSRGPVLEVAVRQDGSGPVPTTSPSASPAPSRSPTPAPSSAGPISPLPTLSTPSTTATPSTPPAPSGGTTGFARPSCAVSAILVPACGMWWGVAPGAFTPTPRDVALRTAEQLAQRPFDVWHAYHVGDQLFPTTAERAAALEPGRNRLLYLNWKPAPELTWRQVADGRANARIDRLAAHIRQNAQFKFFLTVWHEPENDVNPTAGSGKTARDFAAMFRHVVTRLRAGGATSPVVVMNYMGYNGWNVQPWFRDLYPGDDVVDWIGWDPYMSGESSGYHSGDFARMVNRPSGSWPGFYTWVTRTFPDKPIMLAEWGVYEDLSNPQGKAAFFDSVARQISSYPRFKALLYFDTPKDQNGRDSSIDSSPVSLAAFQRLGRNPAFVGPELRLR